MDSHVYYFLLNDEFGADAAGMVVTGDLFPVIENIPYGNSREALDRLSQYEKKRYKGIEHGTIKVKSIKGSKKRSVILRLREKQNLARQMQCGNEGGKS